jgi:hypothetical protein
MAGLFWAQVFASGYSGVFSSRGLELTRAMGLVTSIALRNKGSNCGD